MIPIKDYPDYLISENGDVYSVRIRKMKPGHGGKGRKKYLKVGLCKNNVVKTYRIHRLVAENFIPNPDNKPQVNHRDGDKLNNRVDNLEWATGGENIDHAYNTGLKETNRIASKKTALLMGIANKKRVVQLDKNGAEIRIFDSIKDAKNYFGKTSNSISNCLTGRSETAYGFKWSYQP